MLTQFDVTITVAVVYDRVYIFHYAAFVLNSKTRADIMKMMPQTTHVAPRFTASERVRTIRWSAFLGQKPEVPPHLRLSRVSNQLSVEWDHLV